MNLKFVKALFNQEVVNEVLGRIDKLSPSTNHLWGKMDVAQMLAHNAIILECAVGNRTPNRSYLSLGSLIKRFYYSSWPPYTHRMPTDPTFIVRDQHNFEAEKVRVKNLIRQFYDGGPTKVTAHPHPVFGKLTPDQWAKGLYKHINHHLNQFGV
ncbi:MAG TPA: DUF1569 domain-containing protein [Candidatus Binatia bacterium]|nr:DUF1569 domain-containing protein [Candidatus Binatia bacterium]